MKKIKHVAEQFQMLLYISNRNKVKIGNLLVEKHGMNNIFYIAIYVVTFTTRDIGKSILLFGDAGNGIRKCWTIFY